MAFRSVRMRIFNMSGASLAKTGDQLDHGEFTDSFQPPETIAPNQPADLMRR